MPCGCMPATGRRDIGSSICIGLRHSVISEIATIDSSLRSTRYRAMQSIPELRVWCVQLLFRTYAHVFTLPIFDDRCEYLATLSDGS